MESRSNLIVRVGGPRAQDGAGDIFEFVHLSFQEYLAALALTNDWYPDAQRGTAGLPLIASNLLLSGWAQVIPMAAVLSRTDAVVQLVLNQPELDTSLTPWEDPWAWPFDTTRPAWRLLFSCLLEEVFITPDVAQRAIRVLLESDTGSDLMSGGAAALLKTKFAQLFRETLFTLLAKIDIHAERYADIAVDAALDVVSPRNPQEAVAKVIELLRSPDRYSPLMGAALFAHYSSYLTHNPWFSDESADARDWTSCQGLALKRVSTMEQLSAVEWLLCLGLAHTRPQLNDSMETMLTDAYGAILRAWLESEDEPRGGVPAWALLGMPSEVLSATEGSEALDQHLERQLLGEQISLVRGVERRCAALVVARDLNRPWAREELAEIALSRLRAQGFSPEWVSEFLESLGPVGRDYLEIANYLPKDAQIIPLDDPEQSIEEL